MKTIFTLLFAVMTWHDALAADPIWNNLSASPVGVSYRVTPGQTVYSELRMDKVLAYELKQDIKSKMRGGLGLKFWFSIDAGVLTQLQSGEDWTYFGVKKGRAKAWHGLAGDVLDERDHVGVRRSNRTKSLEWYVDNSFHNGQITIWTRKLEEAELKLLRETTVEDANGNPIRTLIYLGKSQGEIRFRLKELTPNGESLSDVYSYETIAGEDTIVAILGAEISVSDISNTGATMKMVKPFNEIVDFMVPD